MNIWLSPRATLVQYPQDPQGKSSLSIHELLINNLYPYVQFQDPRFF